MVEIRKEFSQNPQIQKGTLLRALEKNYYKVN